ncbi:hypothetical protein EG028_12290 [Chitinophaga barathri]|uniref:Uncharacterized protein n=1 Tax=Chitinophaga barathri TaxID=1647451 RepID=A0A3N4MZL8_9BACT|nr:hypothetical protein EG028_12290 [Chitinophaga barathri]
MLAESQKKQVQVFLPHYSEAFFLHFSYFSSMSVCLVIRLYAYMQTSEGKNATKINVTELWKPDVSGAALLCILIRSFLNLNVNAAGSSKE